MDRKPPAEMRSEVRSEVRSALRTIGTPLTMLCLGLLVINDHVLKHAVPGPVTGKLSDVTGLVVAAALGRLLLAVACVPRPSDVALVVVALGFSATKLVPAVAGGVGGALSLVVPSHIWADPTDLLALPVLLLARHAHRRTRERTGSGPAPLAVGVLLVPFLVVATTATGACLTDPGVREVGVVTGWFDGLPRGSETRLVVDHTVLLVDPEVSVDRFLTGEDARRLQPGPRLVQSCDPADARHCWRLPYTRPRQVEESSDGGATWRTVVTVDDERVDALGESCGDPVPSDLVDIAVLATPSGPVVAVAGENLGLLSHAPGHDWQWTAPTVVHPGDPNELPSGLAPFGRGRLVSREVSPVPTFPFKHMR